MDLKMIKKMIKKIIDKVRGVREPNPFYLGLMRDWGKEDVLGPWTTEKDKYDENGNLKFFKSFYLITTNEPCVIEPIGKNDDKGLL
jgi:hypothetical protein